MSLGNGNAPSSREGRKCLEKCIAVRSESRCMCGHRLKYHKQANAANGDPFRCSMDGCKCPSFFYIVAEGSWILKCSCKHKHTEHNPATHACQKVGCKCNFFHSPWVCNCNHGWADHDMILERRPVGKGLQKLAQDSNAEIAMVAIDINPEGDSQSKIARGL